MKTKNRLKDDPFELPIDLVKSLNDDSYDMLIRRLYELHGSWIREKFKETQAAILILCDRKVVYSSEEEYGLVDGIAKQIEAETKKPCYILSQAPIIEESCSWSEVKTGAGDYYPTIDIYLGNQDWEDQRVFEEGARIHCDLDTGNPHYTVLDERICRNIGGISDSRRGREHIGIPYTCYLRSMKIGVHDGERGACLTKLIEGVISWDDRSRNPYRIPSPNREGFVGRDILLRLQVEVTLNPNKRESYWRLPPVDL